MLHVSTHRNLLDHLPAAPDITPEVLAGDEPPTRPAPFGKHLILDLSGCNDRIRDAVALELFAAEVVDLLGMKAYGPVWLHDFGLALPGTSGYTLFRPIETSALTAHFVNALATAHLDYFSCQEFDDRAAVEHATAFFGADAAVTTVLYR